MQFDHNQAASGLLESPRVVPCARPGNDRLARFVADFSRLLDDTSQEPRIRREGSRLLAALVAQDDWLAPAFCVAGTDAHRQYLLHGDPRQRFSVVCVVWGPGQGTPIHDHTVWGLIGMLRGAEHSQPYRFISRGRLVPVGAAVRLDPGQVEEVSPSIGDIHRVDNAFDDRTSISIHVYGADIGRIERSTVTEAGERVPFVSGYSTLPSLPRPPASPPPPLPATP